MPRSFDDLRNEMSTDALAESAALSLEAGETPLRQLRMVRGISQDEIAALFGSSQATISKLERRSDVHVSTLRRYVQALGGEIEIVAVFPNGSVPLRNLGRIKSATPSEDFKMKQAAPEAFSRILIDQCLRDAGWDILNSSQVRFEVHGSAGRCDYVLLGPHGVLAVLEAKRPEQDPYDAKEQARGYAENYGAPFVLLSNGQEHWFWNYQRSANEDAYRIERLPSPEDLERARLRNLHPPRPLLSMPVPPDLFASQGSGKRLRSYQLRALEKIAEDFDMHRRRKFLLEMATGTGKTLLAAAIIKRFLETRNAERVLFIVDRIELAKQTREEFDLLLRDYKPVIFNTARKTGELLASSIVIATIQSLMVDRRFREEFTPFYFDLVINDEAHRSIYGDSREVVQYFQGTRIGLTATPKAYLKNIDIEQLRLEDPRGLEARQLRDTYAYFGCEPGSPSFRYDLIDAVQDPEGPFLCLPKIFDIRSDITTQALSEKGWIVTIDEAEERYKVQDLEKKIFTPNRNQLMCEAFLKHAQRDPFGNLGRSIVFAVNQSHATALTKIFNEIQPNSAVTITSRVQDAASIAKDFRDGKRREAIAVSVDMLSTGYNCPDLLNIGLMRPIFSPTEYLQIKGRGTRRFKFQDGATEYEKQNFFVLDFCAVAEYFEEKYDFSAPLKLPVTQKNKKRSSMVQIDIETGPQPTELVTPISGGDIPVWHGRDTVVSHEIRIVGPNGEKVDVMTFRGAFVKDLTTFAKTDREFNNAVKAEDDDTIEAILRERFFNKPKMYYSPGKLVLSYGVPAPTSAFVYDALGKRSLPTKDQIVNDTVDSIAARFNLRYSERAWLVATARLIVDDADARSRFLEGDASLFRRTQFNQLGGLKALAAFTEREAAFEALAQSPLVQQGDVE